MLFLCARRGILMSPLFKRKATLDQVAQEFALYAMGELPGMDKNEYDTLDIGDDIDRAAFDVERIFLRVFGIVYGTYMFFGVAQPKANAILETVMALLDKRIEQVEWSTSDIGAMVDERFGEYKAAASVPDSEMGSYYWVGKVFAKHLCSETNSPLTIYGSILFAADIYGVTSILKGTRIMF